MAGVSVRVNQERLRASLNAFIRGAAPAAVDRIVRRTALAVGGEIVRSLNGTAELPKRIDTGRYRAAWTFGVQQGVNGMRHATPTVGALVRVENNVEYGAYVEYGTLRMRPGHHVVTAMLKAAVEMRRAAGLEIPRAWGAS